VGGAQPGRVGVGWAVAVGSGAGTATAAPGGSGVGARAERPRGLAALALEVGTPCPSGMARITVHRDQGADNKDGSVSRFPVRHFRPPPSVMSTVPSTASADRQRRGDRRHQQDERS
jgi:hypothetical protein